MEVDLTRNRDRHVELTAAPLTNKMRELLVLATKARSILKEAMDGLSPDDKMKLVMMNTVGKGEVDPEGELFGASVKKAGVYLDRLVREITGGIPVQTFEIWREGFDDGDGEKEPAMKLADGIPGSDFPDAVEFWYNRTPDAEHIYGTLSFKGEGEKRKAWLWGCRLYDNEQSARRRFG